MAGSSEIKAPDYGSYVDDIPDYLHASKLYHEVDIINKLMSNVLNKLQSWNGKGLLRIVWGAQLNADSSITNILPDDYLVDVVCTKLNKAGYTITLVESRIALTITK